MCRRRSRWAAAEAEPSNAPVRLPKVRYGRAPSCHFAMPLLVSMALLRLWGSDQVHVGLPLVTSQEIGGFAGRILRRRQPPPSSQMELLGMDPIVGNGHRYAAKRDDDNGQDDQETEGDHDNVFDHQQGEDVDHRAKRKSKSEKKDSYYYEYGPPDGGGSDHDDGEHGGGGGGGGGDGQCKLRKCYRYCNSPKKQCGEDCKAIKKLCRKKDCECHLETCNQFCEHWREYCHRRGIKPRQCRRHKRKCGCERPPRPPPTPAPPPTRRPRGPPTAKPPTRPPPTATKQCTPKCEKFCNRPTKACGSDPQCLETREDCDERCDCRPVTCRRFCIEFDEEPRAACVNQGWNETKCLREALFCECTGKEPDNIMPSTQPTTSSSPSEAPSILPSSGPSSPPSSQPSHLPSSSPSSAPSKEPSISPSDVPSSIPSKRPTIVPFESPSASPSSSPSLLPSKEPSLLPSAMPSSAPSSLPSSSPSDMPSTTPSASPTLVPSTAPSGCGSPGGFCGPDSMNTGFCCDEAGYECRQDDSDPEFKFKCYIAQASEAPSAAPSSTPSLPTFENGAICEPVGCPAPGQRNCRRGDNGDLYSCVNASGIPQCLITSPTACPSV